MDFNEEWNRYQEALEFSDYRELLSLRVPREVILDRERLENGIGVAEIAIENGKWVERFCGDRAFIIPAYGPNGDVCEMVAFKPRAARAWWCRSGHMAVLGHENLEQAHWDKAPLFVQETPIEWLRTGCQGVVILDLKHYWPLYLDGIPYLVANSADYGTRLFEALQRPLDVPDVRFAP